ncbi:MAG: FIST N-terminal domain-containing protein [Acidimicrobiales bacterium]
MSFLLRAAPNTEYRQSVDGQRWMNITTVDKLADLDTDLRAMAARIDEEPALALILASGGIDQELAGAALDNLVPGLPTIGCTTAGVLSSSGDVAAAVQYIVLGGPGFSATVGASSYEPHGCRAAGSRLGSAVAQPTRSDENAAFMMLCDGIEGDAAEVIRGAYSISGANCSIVGGCAGDDLAMSKTSQFADGTILSGGVVGAFLTSDAPIGIGVAHGWTKVGEPMIVTASEGTSVLSLDDRPATEAYLELVDEGQVFSDSAEFARFAQTRPLGIHAQSEQVRFVTGSDLKRQTLEFLVHIPEGQMVWVMKGDTDSVVSATTTAAERAISQLGPNPPLGVIGFDCVARRGVLGNAGIRSEVDALSSALPSTTPIGGFYTYGEIARTGGALGLHHQTMVLLAFA